MTKKKLLISLTTLLLLLIAVVFSLNVYHANRRQIILTAFRQEIHDAKTDQEKMEILQRRAEEISRYKVIKIMPMQSKAQYSRYDSGTLNAEQHCSNMVSDAYSWVNQYLYGTVEGSGEQYWAASMAAELLFEYHSDCMGTA